MENQQALLQQASAQPNANVQAPPSEEKDEGLESIINAGKEMPNKKEDKSSIDDDILTQMMMTGENKDGMFTPDKVEDKDKNKEDTSDENVKVKSKGEAKMIGKYAKDFAMDIQQNPQDYKVMTSRGEMTLDEAIKKGWDPKTRSFEHKKEINDAKKRLTEGLSDEEKMNINNLTKQSMPKPQQENEIDPNVAQQMQATEQANQSPLEQTPNGEQTQQLPEQEMQQAQQAPQQNQSIASLLGGNQ